MAEQYAHPEVLVTTDWAEQHLNDPGLRFVEVDVDTTAYAQGHIPGAIGFNWQTQLNDPVRRDIPTSEELEELLSSSGIGNSVTIVLYGDNNNWFAAFAFWLLKHYGHDKVLLIDGGRKKWVAENRPLVKEVPSYRRVAYRIVEVNPEVRALRDLVLDSVAKRTYRLVDVRSVPEFTGEIIAPPGMSETAQRAGHIPGAVNIPWSQAVRDDGTFKSVEELAGLYGSALQHFRYKGLDATKDIIVYCRIGERSSHTWFVLKYLLGLYNVRNYDGSWTEYGNLIGVPIEKEANTSAPA